MWDLIVYSNSTNSSRTYSLDSLAFVSLMGHDGLGMPPVENFFEQQAQQDGGTYLGTRINPRPVHLVFGSELEYNDDLWERRQAILRALKPGLRLGLRHTSEKGIIRQLDCYYADGLQMPSNTKVGQILKVGVTLLAYSPYFYDPTMVVTTYHQDLVNDVFPAAIIEHTYEGSADDSPVIFLENSVVDETANEWENPYLIMYPSYTKIHLRGYTIPAGERVTIQTAYGLKSITDSFGNNLMSYLTDDSDLSSFCLQAADDGTESRVNTFLVGSSPATPDYPYSYKVTFRSFKRYLGI